MRATFDLARADAATIADLRTYATTWRTTALAAVSADRPAAEAAVTELYERARLAPPRFAWVASPAAGAVAERLIGYPHEERDPGPSYRRIVIEPDRLRPAKAWSAEVRRWMGDQPLDDPRFPRPRRPLADLLGFDALRSSLRVVAGSGALAGLPDPSNTPARRSGAIAFGDAEWAAVTRALPGTLVDELLRRIGREVCRGVRDAVGPRSPWLASIAPWMLGQLDPLGPYLAAAHEVLGRRATAESRDQVAPFLVLALSTGPWVALDGLAILSERPTRRSDLDNGQFQLAYADGLAITGAARGRGMTTLPDFAATFTAIRDALLEEGLRWDDVARSTDPADRPAAEAAVRMIYRLVNRPEPSIAWVGSPRGLLAASTLIAPESLLWLSNRLRNPSWGTGAFAPWTLDWRSVRTDFGAADRTTSLAQQVAAAIDTVVRHGRLEPGPDVALARDLVGEAAWSALEGSLGDLAAEVVASFSADRMGDWTSRQRSSNRALDGFATGNLDQDVALAAAAGDVLGIVPPDTQALLGQFVVVARSAGPWLMGEDQAVLSDRPLRLRLDDRGRLHAIDGPALAYGDGTEAFAIHGVVVPPHVVTDPDAITIDQIDAEANVEVRRVLVERFGVERLIREGGATLLNEDETGRLWRRELRTLGWSGRDEPIVMVEVVNSTAEPDGTRKTYFLRVPPETRTAREAVAWTFGLGGAEYRPEAES